MVELDIHAKIFKTPYANNAVHDLLTIGPLAKIYKEPKFRFKSAKGSAIKSEWMRYSSQTYFMHALNVSIIAAHLLEEETLWNKIGDNVKFFGTDIDTETAYKILLSSGTLHDLNKLLDLPLSEAVEKNKELIAGFIEGYIDTAYIDDILFLILSTEGSTSGYSLKFKPKLPGQIISRFQTYLEAADRLAGANETSNALAYSESLSNLRESSLIIKDIKIVTIVPRPQSLLTGALRRVTIKHLRKTGRRVLHEGTDFISYIGPDLTKTEFGEIDNKLTTELDITVDAALLKCRPSHNSIPWNWAETIEPTPENIIKYFDTWKKELILSDGQGNWNPPAVLFDSRGKLPIKIQEVKSSAQKRKIYMDIPPEDNLGLKAQRQMGLIGIACCAALYTNTIEPPSEAMTYAKDNGYELDQLNGVILSTVKGLAWGNWICTEKKDIPKELNSVLNQISAVVKTQNHTRPPPWKGFSENTILTTSSNIIMQLNEKIEKTESCYQCGATGEYNLEAVRVYGYGAQSSTGIKLTKLSDTGKGMLCAWCVAENQYREKEFKASKGSVVIHIHLSDIVPDVDRNDIFTLLNSGSGGVIDKENERITFLPKGYGSCKMDGHITELIEPWRGKSQKEKEWNLLMDLYQIAMNWGVKVHATSLMSNPSPPRAMLFWENAPSWTTHLNLNEARPEEIVRNIETMKSLRALGNAQQISGDGLGNFIIDFIRNPLHMYHVFIRAQEEKNNFGKEEYIKILEERYMSEQQKSDMTRLAEIGIAIAPSPNWSANDWRWVMAEALRALEQAREQKMKDEVGFVSAQISAYGLRFSKYAATEKIDTLCKSFSEGLLKFLNDNYDGLIPNGIGRSYLINHYAYEYRTNYRKIRPKEE